MNLLLVDDEQLVLSALEEGIDWSQAGIHKVFTSRNITQAKKILSEETIDVILCDIEMPGGSGLELLGWIQERELDAVCIMLTCHADFDYCVQTLQLRGFDYIVKPAPNELILETVKRAVHSLEAQKTPLPAADPALLERNRNAALDALWRDFLFGDLRVGEAPFRDLMAQADFPLTEESQLTLVLTQFQSRLPVTARQRFRQLAAQTLNWNHGRQLELSPRQYLCIYPRAPMGDTELETLCRNLADAASHQLDCALSCVYASSVPLPDLPETWRAMVGLAQQDAGEKTAVCSLNSALPRSERIIASNTTMLMLMLLEGQREGFLDEVRKTLRSRGRDRPLSQSELRAYTISVMNTLYEFIRQSCSSKEAGPAMELVSRGAYVQSISDFEGWLMGPVSEVLKSVSLTSAEKTVERVKRYIRGHLGERLMCESIAKQVYLNPDYLERIFKREVGMTLTDYITQSRLDLAATLIRSTNMPISSISQEVGYISFSYFSKLFKRQTGLSPRNYRRQWKDEQP